jgi:hypothetical protein
MDVAHPTRKCGSEIGGVLKWGGIKYAVKA